MDFFRQSLSEDLLLDIYKKLLLPRLIEEKMLILLRQGKISKWFSGIGQEAISVGATLALNNSDWIMPLHRNLGVFTSRDMSLSKLFIQWQGGKEGYSKGRERSFHFGSREHHICGMISHLGSQLSVANGVALSYQFRNEKNVALAFSGDGGTSEGDFHEALNVAAVWGLPVIFIIENNGYGLSTPNHEQFRCEKLIDKAKGYGIDGLRIDGNNVLEVYNTIKSVREYCINSQKPYLIECMTFRMRGHEEASDTKYVPKELLEEWATKDPIENYQQYLLSENILTESSIASISSELKNQIEKQINLASHTAPISVDSLYELADVYAPRSEQIKANKSTAARKASSARFIDAVSQGLEQSMIHHPELILMGQDIAEYGGAFKITEGFLEKFGKQRIKNTPLCESAIAGICLGLSLAGIKSIMEMQFADFASVAFNQIVNNLAKVHYRWGQNADVVIRMPTGGGIGAGPFHSQSTEAWFTHVPGLKIVYPSNPFDAKGLLIAAVNDPNPVLFFEHKALYRSVTGFLPDDYYEIEIGKAALVRTGEDITVITYGAGVHWATEYQQDHTAVSLHILDLRTLLPLDYDSIREAVKKTGKVLILHEDTLTGGIGGEISAWISEHCFKFLDAPILRCASLDTPVPFNTELEKNFMAKSRLDQSIQQLMQY